jgi:cell division protein FtsI/penicillin-binding protein 2
MRRSPLLLLILAGFVLTPSLGAGTRSRRSAPKRAATRTVVLPDLIAPPSPSPRDLAVAEACRRGLAGTTGAVVAMDPWSGRVLAVVNPREGLVRAYTPCSVFKIVVAVAGLSEGIITPDTTYNCTTGCWTWPGHGPINLRRALAVSCNPYFEWVGQQLGYERIQRYAQLLGLGAPSGINLTGESSGLLPESVRADRVPHMSSHATGIATSAVQLAVLLSATINGGVVYQPQVAGPEGFVPKERWRLPAGTVLHGLGDGFLAAVDEGSASLAFDPEIPVAGKTGSCAHLGWFASYAPADKPEIVVVVFLRSGNGHRASAVAGRIYQDLYRYSAAAPTAAGAR